MKGILKVVSVVLAVAYPFVVFLLMWKFHVGARGLVFVLLGMAFVYFISNSGNLKAGGLKRIQLFGMLFVSLLLAFLTFITENKGFVKLYPILVNFFLLIGFGSTLFVPPTMIFRFALMQDKDLEQKEDADMIRAYCRKVTIVWCCFFIINALISLGTTLWGSDLAWTLYNGMISYILIGILFVTEFIIRKRVQKK